MPIGNLTAFLQYIMQILFSVMTAVIMFVLVPRAAVSAGRIREVLDTDPTIADPRRRVAPRPAGRRGRVRRRLVRLPGRRGARPERHVIHAPTRARRRPSSAARAAARRTLINLLPRFYDATDGAVLVDGVDVRELDREDLWRRIGFVPQKAFLFSGTVASNLRYGDEEATDDELWHALEIAQGSDFVEAHARAARRRRSPRAAPTSPAASGNGSRSPARS